jgi:hypothetical protein
VGHQVHDWLPGQAANPTGINISNIEVATKRLGLLHELVPKTIRIGPQSQVLNASTSDEIDTAFVTVVRERADALFVAADGFFISRRVQSETLTVRDGIPAELVPGGAHASDFPDLGYFDKAAA